MTTTQPSSDDDLLRQMRSGQASAFQTLYQRYQGPVYRFALLRSASPSLAADIVQEVFMGLLTDAYQFDPLRGALRSFLFGVARNLILKHEQPQQRFSALPELPEDGDDDGLLETASEAQEPLARMLDKQLAEQVRAALAALPPHYRDVVILFEMHELSYLEIAHVCQIDIGTVRSRLSRARGALAKRLAPARLHQEPYAN